MKQVMDMRPSKGITTAQSDEHQRNWTDRGWCWAEKHGNYDRSREPLNFEVVKGGVIQTVDKTRSIPQRMAENLKERGIADPNAGLTVPKYRTVVNIIFGGSRDRMNELAFGNQKVSIAPGTQNPGLKRKSDIEKWAQDMYKFTCDKWGEQNVVAFIVHLDEMNVHAHATILPIEPTTKRFSYNKIFGGNIYACRDYITKLHDELAAINKKWGLDRGDNIHETGAKHRSTEEYRRELSRQCTSLEQQIEMDQSLLEELKKEMRMAETRVKGLTTMISNAEQSKASLEQQLKSLNEELAAGKGDSEALKKQISNLDYELQKVMDSLADKRGKLADATRKLSELKEVEEEARRQIASYRAELSQAAYDLQAQVRFRLADALLSDVIKDFRKALPEMDSHSRELFDDSLLEGMAERGEGIIKCAMLLFAEYVNEATEFAKGSGGGGGGSDLPWGRKEDEDDRAWALRCLMQANRMMRSSGSRSVKRK
jgi:predicted  nucleic acid-binding Zn-ribbon protein